MTQDDAEGFFDRSLGTVTNGPAAAGPHQLLAASNRATSSARQGDLDTVYDPAGNLTDLIVRRDGPCMPSGASCWQRFRYEWDPVGQLSRARRWDLSAANPNERSASGTLGSPLPTRAPDVELRYSYDGAGRRVLKTGIEPNAVEQHTVYIFGGLELRSTSYAGSGASADYTLNAQTETVYLPAGGARARVLYAEEDLPTLTSGDQHIFLIFSDHLGSGSFIIDHETGELVEYSTYQAYGQTDSDYRPGRWGQFREPYKFSGKEEDVEVGLAYFGARYLSLGLNRWMSADPATIHGLGSDANPYAYVKGRPLVAVDPEGRIAIIAAIAIGVVVGAVIAGGTSAGVQYATTGHVNWGWNGVARAAVAGGIAGGLTGGLGAAGAGVWAGAAGGAASAGTSAALSGQGAGGIALAAGLGAVGGLAAGALASELNGVSMQLLEPTGISLSAAVQVSAATSGTLTGAATGLATEFVRNGLDAGYDADYGRAAGIGAATGFGGYVGAAASGQLPNPGPGQSTPEGASRRASFLAQSMTNRSANAGLVREAGALTYEWGGQYYSTDAVLSKSQQFTYEEDVREGVWIPEGATLSGFSHSHPPPDETMRLASVEVQTQELLGASGFHVGDKAGMDSAWVGNGRPPVWVEGISNPEGSLDFYYPGSERIAPQPRLRGLPTLR